MKVILFGATSVNGIISSHSSNEEFLSDENWVEFIKYVKESGCVILGRKTYENLKTWSTSYTNLLNEKNIVKIILSRKLDLKLEDGYVQSSSPEKALNYLSGRGFTSVILGGGSLINTAFAEKDLIDEIVLDLQSIFISSGKPLFEPREFELPVRLIESKNITEHILQLHYKVRR